MKLNCVVCKGEFDRKPSEKGKYCSRTCFFSTLRGVKRSPEIGGKISKSKSGIVTRVGFYQTEETKQKMRESARLAWQKRKQNKLGE